MPVICFDKASKPIPMRMASVSALVMCRNGADYIGKTLEAAAPNVDEFIVCDTGSTDGTIEIVRELLPKLGRRHFFWLEPVEEDIGFIAKHGSVRLTEIRNKLVEMASGDWSMILDQDEIWDFEMLRAAVDEIGRLPRAINYVANRALHYLRVMPPKSRIASMVRFEGYRFRFFRNGIGIRFKMKFPYETLSWPDSYQCHTVAKLTGKNSMLRRSPFFFHHFSLSKKFSIRAGLADPVLNDRESNVFRYCGIPPEVMRRGRG